MSLAALCVYLRYLWKHRIRPEVLVDPPDSEDWVTLSSYDLEQQYVLFVRKLWSMWINLRGENHLMVNRQMTHAHLETHGFFYAEVDLFWQDDLQFLEEFISWKYSAFLISHAYLSMTN